MRGPDIARLLFHALLVRPFVWFVLGLNPRNRERLRCPGPAIIVANHNNHIDTLILMSLFPLRQLCRLRAAAADDYFFRNRALAWFAVSRDLDLASSLLAPAMVEAEVEQLCQEARAAGEADARQAASQALEAQMAAALEGCGEKLTLLLDQSS